MLAESRDVNISQVRWNFGRADVDGTPKDGGHCCSHVDIDRRQSVFVTVF